MTRRALIAGVTGLIGSNLAEHLLSKNWDVYGLARKPESNVHGVKPIAADLLDPEALRTSLADVGPTQVFFTTWVRRETEEENVAANGALVRNVLSALQRSKTLEHVALVTGLKHYLGPFEMYAKVKLDTPLREEMPRLPYPNFFYAQEDALFEAARQRRSHREWPKPDRSGGISRENIALPNPISASFSRRGTPTWTWAVRSRW